MSAIPTPIANAILDAVLNGGSVTLTVAPIKARLMSANGSESAAGTQITAGSGGGVGSGYTSGGLTITWDAATGRTKTSNVALSWLNMPARTIAGLELWDSDGTPKRAMWGAFPTSRSTLSGDNFTIVLGGLQAQLPS